MYLQHFQHHWNESCDICGVSRSRSRIPLVITAIALVTLLLLTSLLLTGCAGGSDGDNNESQTSQQTSSSEGTSASSKGSTEFSRDNPATPLTAGALQVLGAQLCAEDGSPVQLRGVSTHGLSWYPQYVNQSFFQELRNDWNANVVRLSLYTAESGGYCTDGDDEALYDLVYNGVNYAAEADLYAVVDWHILSDSNPLQHVSEAKDFFARMSADLADHTNVLYEICNEPNGATTWEDITNYANQIIPVIRANAPDAVIIVGTPTWSQETDKALAAPLDAENVMYALHFYAATHQQDLRDRLSAAVDGGLPVFVTEFGICDASGDGRIDYASANAWIELMDDLDVSYICWNLSNKDEASALFKTSCDKVSGFTKDDLSDEGRWLMDVLHGERE